MATKSVGKDSRKSSEGFTNVKAYLLLYNALQVVGWSYILYLTINYYVDKKSSLTLWSAVNTTLYIFQNAAILEILNVALGFVRSSLFLTAAQVASRVVVVGGVLAVSPAAQVSYGLPLLLVAWSVTEVIRYSYYALSLINSVPYFIIWCRYTFFYALYPIGVAGELLCFYAAQSYFSQNNIWILELPNYLNFTFRYHYCLVLLMSTYIPMFPQLFMYMVRQRKKVIGGYNRDKKD